MIRRFYPSNKALMRMGAAVCLAAVAALAMGGHGTAEPAAAIVNENGPMIALTFDDGPYPKVTGHIPVSYTHLPAWNHNALPAH